MKKRKKVFEDILYAQCWEDPSLDREAFNITDSDTVFSITSGGCNVLAFLIDNPQKVIALDLNPYQNFLLDLKIAAFDSLTYAEMLEFMGIRPSRRRWELYLCLRPRLMVESCSYWDTQRTKIEIGIIHCGRYEQYMALLRRWLHRLMGEELINKFYENEDMVARSVLYTTRWNNIWWKIFTRVLLSRRTMSLLFDKAFFAYLDKSFSFGRHFAERTRRALTILPMQENYFLSYILLGCFFDENNLPPYLRRENFNPIRKNLQKVQIVSDGCERYFSSLPDSSITKFNFTNIFEWMSQDDYENLLRQTFRVAKDGAIMTYRNLLVPRERPVRLANEILPHRDLAKQLHDRDLSFIYNKYVVEQIIKKEQPCAAKFVRDGIVTHEGTFSASHI